MLGQFLRDARAFARANGRDESVGSVLKAISEDGFQILALQRMRSAAVRFHIPGVNRILRMTQSILFGIELDKDAELGDGVAFIHTHGVVVGPTKIGARVRFMGNNTIGSLEHGGGEPIVEDDVTIGAGARILGQVRIGARAVIGANAVVTTDVPADTAAMGNPARILKNTAPSPHLAGTNRAS